MQCLILQLVSIDLGEIKRVLLPARRPEELVVGNLSETLWRVWWAIRQTAQIKVEHEAASNDPRDAMSEVDWVLLGAELDRREVVLRELLRGGVKQDYPQISDGRYEIRLDGSIVYVPEGADATELAEVGYIGTVTRVPAHSRPRR